LAFAAIPILFSELGAEAYGLIGLAVTLESLFTVLDLGLSTTVNREVARNIGTEQPPEINRDLLRTLEVVYWPIGLVILASVLAASGWIASSGLNTSDLSARTVEFAFAVLAFTLTIRWPMSLYAGVLRGLQAQLLSNGLMVFGTFVRLVGGVAVVIWVSPTIEAFFLVDLVGSSLQALMLAVAAWRSLPSGRGLPKFRIEILRSLWRFALAYNGVVVLFQILLQSGVLFVAKLLPLQEVGYYAVASSLAGVVVYVPYALVDASFPRFTAVLERGDAAVFKRIYGLALDISATAVMAIAVPIIFFSGDLLLVWTRSSAVSAGAASTAALIATGNLFYALWALPYIALVAAGMVRLPLVVNLIVVPLALVALPFAISVAGLLGAAAVWLAASAVLLAVYPVALERRVGGSGGVSTWFRPAAIVLCAVAAFSGLARVTQNWSPSSGLVAAALCDMALTGLTLAWLRLRRGVGLKSELAQAP
jgi:O-antigen/teichoic acid export membrane protein